MNTPKGYIRKTAFSFPEKKRPEFICTFFTRSAGFLSVYYRDRENHNLCIVYRQRREYMEDLTAEQVEEIHDRIMEEEKGDCRVLSEANLHQLIFQANLIPECVPRAAFVLYYLSAYPAFREGNAGTALVVAAGVLACGGYRITGDKAGIMALADGIHAFTTDPEEIEQWLCKNIRKSVSG